VEFVVERHPGSPALQRMASVTFAGKKWFSLKSRRRRLSRSRWTISTKVTTINPRVFANSEEGA